MSEAEDAMQKAILARIAAHASTAAKVTEMATKMPTSQLKAVIGGDAKSGGDKKKMKIGDMDEKELIASTLEQRKASQLARIRRRKRPSQSAPAVALDLVVLPKEEPRKIKVVADHAKRIKAATEKKKKKNRKSANVNASANAIAREKSRENGTEKENA